MAATINNFIAALDSPLDFLVGLSDLAARCDASGKVVVSRTKHFADAQIEWREERFLLSLPLTAEGLARAQQCAVKLRQKRSTILCDYRIEQGALTYIDACDTCRHADLLLEQLPANGTLLLERIARLDPERLLHAVDLLQCEMERLKIEHGNLKCENIFVTDDYTLYPLRPHYAKFGGSNRAEFAALRSEICAVLGVEPPAQSVAIAVSQPCNALFGYLEVDNPFEGMCVARNEEGYGYIDCEGHELIAPQFLWAGDMREGRAEVETSSGMGLIDNRGNFIIEPRYQIVEFDIKTGHSRVKSGQKWLTFDYNGVLLDLEDIEAAQEARAAL